MRNSVLGPLALIAGLCALPVAASAESYICAVSQVYECVAVEGCKQVSTDAINLAELIVLDTDKKTLTGASLNETPQSEDIEGLEMNMMFSLVPSALMNLARGAYISHRMRRVAASEQRASAG